MVPDSRAPFSPWALAVMLALAACQPPGGRSPAETGPLRVVRFNYAGAAGVPLNAPLIFTFSQPVDPATVNSDTIRIWTVLDGRRITAPGVYVASGRRVTWYPRISSLARPAPGSEALLPADAGLNTRASAGLRYEVVVPALPEVNTIRTLTGEPLRLPFVSYFYTVPGRADRTRLFRGDLGVYREPLRVADVLAYSPVFRAWVAAPDAFAPENPLYLNPTLLVAARSLWPRRHLSGEWVDKVFGLRLVPPVPPELLPAAALPRGLRQADERFLAGRVGRTVPVQALSIPFTQPLDPELFLGPDNRPRPWTDQPFVVRLLAAAAEDPAAANPLPYTLVLRNGPEPETGRILLVFHRPLRRGWLRLDVDPQRVRGITGRALEPNSPTGFTYLWPVPLSAP